MKSNLLIKVTRKKVQAPRQGNNGIIRILHCKIAFLDLKHIQMVELALYQPDIPQNTGTMLRLCACLDIKAHIIEPAGFPITDKHFRRSGMDYLDQVHIERHISFMAFQEYLINHEKNLILLSTKSTTPYTQHKFSPKDILMLGRESAGVPQNVFESAHQTLLIPMKTQLRSLNVAVSAAMVLGEALRQTNHFVY